MPYPSNSAYRSLFAWNGTQSYVYLSAVLVKIHSSRNAFSRCSEDMVLIGQIEQYGLLPRWWCISRLQPQKRKQSMICQPFIVLLFSDTFSLYSLVLIWFKSTTSYPKNFTSP